MAWEQTRGNRIVGPRGLRLAEPSFRRQDAEIAARLIQ